MALPKSKKIRKLTVDNVKYYWTVKYDEDYGLITCNVGLVSKPNHRFSFVRGVDENHKRYIHNGIKKEDEINSITPSLIKQAILYANENEDWQNEFDCMIDSNAKGFNHYFNNKK